MRTASNTATTQSYGGARTYNTSASYGGRSGGSRSFGGHR
jgi:hypothetical protein